MPRRKLTVAFVLLVSCAASTLVAAESNRPAPLTPVYFQTIEIDGFWKSQFKRLIERWIPHCIKQMEAGGRGQELMNLVNAAKTLRGEPHDPFTGCPWSDAYVYNTVEAICLALSIDATGDQALTQTQADLQAKLETWIPIILAAQHKNGYIQSFHTINGHQPFSNTGWHDFYVQGYFIEMGVAHYRVTGGKDRRLYDAVRRCADHLCETFGPPPKTLWIHGHPGMGYALCRLARLVNETEGEGRGDKYFELAKFLLDNRHTNPQLRSAYMQSHRPVVEMTDAVGHAVRGTYFYTAMADLAMLTGDDGYRTAIERVWISAIDRKHYITGGVGASHQGEAFSRDYDLRNDGYCESCASCGLTFWADRMCRMHHDAHPIDVQERALYNNILGAMELSGVNFFYQNPLASEQSRYPWHGCPCCVGNIPRSLLGIKDQIYQLDASRQALYVNHYVASEGTIGEVAGTPLTIRQETDYPWRGEVKITLSPKMPAEFTVKIRIPDRTESDLYRAVPDLDGQYTIRINGKQQNAKVENGYAILKQTWNAGDVVELALPTAPQRIYCSDLVAADRGRVALTRGPIVYNVEQVDHDCEVCDIVLPPDAALSDVWRPELLEGVMVIEAKATVPTDQGVEPVELRAVPNYARLNRGGWSQVWIVEDPEKVLDEETLQRQYVKLIARPQLDRRTIDRVVVGDSKSEKDHNLQGERTSAGIFNAMRWRHAGGGWFGYSLKVKPGAANYVLVTYWGSDVGNRRFDVIVDGNIVGHQTLDNNEPGKFFDVEYPIPADLITGKETVVVKIQSAEGATAGGIFDLRTVIEEIKE